MKKLMAVLLSLIMLLALFTACGTSGSGEEKTLTTAVTSPWSTLCPHYATTDIELYISYLMYDSLISVDLHGDIHPGIASSYDISDDGTVYTFHLNKDAKWHDGKKLTADDVLFTVHMLSNAEYNSRSSLLSFIDGTADNGFELSDKSINVVAEDDYTVVVTLKFPVDELTFLNEFKRVRIIPEHLFGDMAPADIANSELWTKPVGSGSLIYDAELTGESIELVANKDYHLGAPKIDRFTVKVLTSSALAAALISGDIDFTPGSNICGLLNADYELLSEEKDLIVEPIYIYAYQYLTVNQTFDYFSDVRVRQALSMAINRQEIVDTLLNGFGYPAYTPYPPNHPYYNENLNLPEYDPEGAKALLEEAGWDFNREIVITTATGNETRERSALMVQQYWQAIGVKVRVDTVDFATMFAGLRAGELDVGTMGQTGAVTAVEPTDAYTPGHIIDFSKLQTDSFYQSYAKMRGTNDKDVIRETVYALQQQIIDEVPYIYTYHQATLQCMNKRVLNVDMTDGSAYYWPVWEWDVA